MIFPARPRMVRFSAAIGLLALAGACTGPMDFDQRGVLGGFSTTDAALSATSDRPKPDARGVITYPTYQVVVSRRGETPSGIARRLGIDATDLARYNGVGEDVTLRSGEVLALPHKIAGGDNVDIASLAGAAIDAAPDTTPVATTTLPPAKPAPVSGPEPLRHKVARGETAYTISRLYQVPVKSLAEWNGLGPDLGVHEGQVLLIPLASQKPPATATVASATAAAPAATVTRPGQGSPTPLPPSASTPLPDEVIAPATEVETVDSPVGPPSKPSTSRMGFPVKGNIIRAYSKGKTEGIDIAAEPGSPVKASADGTVAAITEDADQVPIIVVRHPGNLLTVYANVDKIRVKKGDKVKRGQELAVLRTGKDAYVHFEVRDGFDSVDPMPYLE